MFPPGGGGGGGGGGCIAFLSIDVLTKKKSTHCSPPVECRTL